MLSHFQALMHKVGILCITTVTVSTGGIQLGEVGITEFLALLGNKLSSPTYILVAYNILHITIFCIFVIFKHTDQ